MSTSNRLRLAALGLAAAGVVAAAALARDGLRVNAAEPPASVQQPGAPAGDSRSVQVEAPDTQVNVDKQRGRVSVTAPHTDVQVDPDQGRVRVRAPYVNLDVNW